MGAVQTILKNTVKSEEIHKVLEVGVGRGDFINVLFDCFHENTHYTGVDILEEYLDIASELYKEQKVDFLQMNAESLAFEDNFFDIVCISNTLHHLPDVHKVLEEMKRVVKPEGYVIIHEMVKDDQTQKQNSHVWLHHLSADIDSEIGIHHGHTYTRTELKKILNELELNVISQMEYQLQDEQSFGDEREILDNTFEVMNKRINKIDDKKIKETFRNDLNENMERLYETGIELATEYMAITSLK